MTSYLRYQKELITVQDADDIESWITVRGNHIPIKKGQSKEDAVKSFLENKGRSASKSETPKTESSKKWSGAWSKRANKPVTLGEATKKATEISKKQAEKKFKSTEIPANKLKVGDVVKHDGELFKVYKSDKNNLHLESKESTMLVHKNDKTSKYMSVSPQEKEKLDKVLNKLNSKYDDNYKKWTEKKPELNINKLMKGDLEEFSKFNSWEKSAGAMKYEQKRDFINKIFGSEKKYWTALHNQDISRKERAKVNKNYLDDDIASGLLEIAYNDTNLSTNPSKNRSVLLKAIKASKHENSAEMTELIQNLPDNKVKNIGALIRYIQGATEGKK